MGVALVTGGGGAHVVTAKGKEVHLVNGRKHFISPMRQCFRLRNKGHSIGGVHKENCF